MLPTILIVILSFQILVLWPYFLKHWNSDLILPNIVILALFLQTLEFWSYSSKSWCSGPIFLYIAFLILSFQPWELWPYLKRLAFWSYSSSYWNAGAIFINIGILIFFFKTFEFRCFFCKRRNSDLILSNIGILALFSLVCLLQSGCAGPINYHVFLPWTLASLGIDRSI